MNAKKLIAAVAVFATTGSVFASELIEGVYPAANFTPTKTRAEVVAELKASKEDGSYYLARQLYEGQDQISANQYARVHGRAGTAVAGSVSQGQAN